MTNSNLEKDIENQKNYIKTLVEKLKEVDPKSVLLSHIPNATSVEAKTKLVKFCIGPNASAEANEIYFDALKKYSQKVDNATKYAIQQTPKKLHELQGSRSNQTKSKNPMLDSLSVSSDIRLLAEELEKLGSNEMARLPIKPNDNDVLGLKDYRNLLQARIAIQKANQQIAGLALVKEDHVRIIKGDDFFLIKEYSLDVHENYPKLVKYITNTEPNESSAQKFFTLSGYEEQLNNVIYGS